MSMSHCWERMGVSEPPSEDCDRARALRAELRLLVVEHLRSRPGCSASLAEVARVLGVPAMSLGMHMRHWTATVVFSVREKHGRGEIPVILTLHPDLCPPAPPAVAPADLRRLAVRALKGLR